MSRTIVLKYVDDSSVECSDCGLLLTNTKDLRKHVYEEGAGMSQVRYRCSWANCFFEAAQRSNMKTHYCTWHSKEKRNACPECDFKTCDPGSLTRHRKRIHKYVPKPRKARTLKKPRYSPHTFVASSYGSDSESSQSSSSLPTLFPYSFLPLSFLSKSDSSESLTSCNDNVCDIEAASQSSADDFPREAKSVTGFNQAWCDVDCSTESLTPRPLLPAVESTPSLEEFGQFQASDFSFLHADNNAVYSFPDLAFSQNDPFGLSWDLDQSLNQLAEPGSFDIDFGVIGQMDSLDPSTADSARILESDLQAILGYDYERLV
ncbi:hypothetical protein D9757_007671 [Collybiopsis confluens]|uniref:C2H2-type domain-containing protein n=1 Tax=Collybiopsis confluens TaxID=2823264 RepID=A0A8H5H9U1_9AGAR|nr:hypothetical protein D9757_007671 [Collybiopsis confluens]